MNGTSTAEGLPSEWDPDGGEGSNLVWKRDDLGTRSSPVVMQGSVYFLARHEAGTPAEREKVVCLDAETGETRWEHIFNIFLTDVPDTRVAWSNVVADPESGRVFALGVCDQFLCLDAKSGDVVWERSLSEQFGMLSTYGGRTNMPIVVGDTVIVSGVIIGWGEMAKPAHRFIGFDKNDGTVRWFNGTRLLPDDTTYSAPVLTAFNGRPAIVFGSGDGGVHAFEPLTGRPIWKFDISSRGINTTPVVDHETGIVYCGHSEENNDSTAMGSIFALDGNRSGDLTGEPKWRVDELFIGKAAPLLIDQKVFAVDDRAKLFVLDAQSASVLDDQRMGTMQRMSPVYADGKIYTAEANGRLYTLKPTDDGVEVLFKGRLPRGEECHGSPAVANGRLYWPTTGAIYCIGSSDAKPAEADTSDLPPIELAAAGDTSPVHLQIVPAEALVLPGETMEYSIRLFDDLGRYIRDAAADEVELQATIDSQTPCTESPETLTARVEGLSVTTSGNAFAGLSVSAKLKNTDLEGGGRLRVEPKLDWTFTFDDLQVPLPWVGAAYRMVTLDGSLLDELRESDPTAADLYIFLGASLINSGAPKLTYDDSTPDQKWTDLLRFFGRDTGSKRPGDLAAAKEAFDSSLQTLVDRGILKGYEWSEWSRSEGGLQQPRLVVLRGEVGQPRGGNGVLCKIRTIPKGARSQSWMGWDDLSEYTITADVKAFSRDGKLPDIGLIGQRYTLDMMGASQQLQIRTWTPQLYMAETVPFEWQADTWYRMKFQTSLEDGQAVLHGKVWPRDGEEPSDWTVVAKDDQPNQHGSPGLFGNAKDSEILYDNIRVTANGSD